jgi:hypothetical protein
MLRLRDKIGIVLAFVMWTLWSATVAHASFLDLIWWLRK